MSGSLSCENVVYGHSVDVCRKNIRPKQLNQTRQQVQQKEDPIVQPEEESRPTKVLSKKGTQQAN